MPGTELSVISSFGSNSTWADASEFFDDESLLDDKWVPGTKLVPPPGQWDMSTPASVPEVARATIPATSDVDPENPEGFTTLLVEGLPETLTRADLLNFLACEGLLAACDFVYLPLDLARQNAAGYALVNVSDTKDISALWAAFGNDGSFRSKTGTACQVKWNGSGQGLPALIEKFRNSQLMHRSVDDSSRPILLHHGVRVPFPPPTKAIRAPRPLAARHKGRS